ncbi:MAG: hypothetical protein P1Q69_12455 [Candidatus Thorarchaeota archaeon]|nr:hypothetical protein [Candidatus Thorarchaeota archaeon]
MEEIDKVLEALSVVEKYEDYLFLRSLGRSLLVIGTILPLGMFILINADLLALITGLDSGVMGLYANILTLILCWGLVMYSFIGAWRTQRKESDRESGGALHAPLIALVWFLSFIMTSFAPTELILIAMLWAASVSCLLSFVILRLTHSHGQELLILYLGLVLGVTSFLLLAILDSTITGILVPLVFSFCFIAAGIMMHRQASEALQAK